MHVIPSMAEHCIAATKLACLLEHSQWKRAGHATTTLVRCNGYKLLRGPKSCWYRSQLGFGIAWNVEPRTFHLFLCSSSMCSCRQRCTRSLRKLDSTCIPAAVSDSNTELMHVCPGSCRGVTHARCSLASFVADAAEWDRRPIGPSLLTFDQRKAQRHQFSHVRTRMYRAGPSRT